MKAAWYLAVALTVAAASRGYGQTLADRVAAVGEGTVVLRYATRPGVCGGGDDNVNVNRSGGYVSHCFRGPIWVKIARSGGDIVSIRTHMGDRPRSWPDVHDLGEVPADEASRYFLGLASTLPGSSAETALTAAVVADAPDPSPQLRQLTLNRDRPTELRQNALFWLGQSDEPIADLVSLYGLLDSRTLREHFAFVLSQRHEDAATTELIQLVRHDDDRDVRKQALFWLGQSKDPNALQFIRDLLTK